DRFPAIAEPRKPFHIEAQLIAETLVGNEVFGRAARPESTHAREAPLFLIHLFLHVVELRLEKGRRLGRLLAARAPVLIDKERSQRVRNERRRARIARAVAYVECDRGSFAGLLLDI